LGAVAGSCGPKSSPGHLAWNLRTRKWRSNSGFLRVLTVGRQIAIEQGGAGDRPVEIAFHGATVRIRGEDQESEDQGGQSRHKSRGKLDHIRRVLA